MIKGRTIRACPACGSLSGQSLYYNNLALLNSLNLSYTVDVCGECQAVYASNTAHAEEYDRYYVTFSKYDIGETPVQPATVKMHQAMASMVAEAVPLDSCLVDLGCGSGHFLSLLKSAGFINIHGIEPAPNAPLVAKTLYGVDNVLTGFIGDFCNSNLVYEADVCCMGAVLEHFYNPYAQLLPLTAKLKPNAMLVIEVPDLDAFNVEAAGPYEELSIEHINYFSLRSLQALFIRLGFDMIISRRLFHTLGGSILAIFRKVGDSSELISSTKDSETMRRYLERSGDLLAPLLTRAFSRLNRETYIYGGGSHTARLLPKIKEANKLHYIKGIIDRNPNLIGASMEGINIVSRDVISSEKNYDILISSYNFETEILQSLTPLNNRNIITVYKN